MLVSAISPWMAGVAILFQNPNLKSDSFEMQILFKPKVLCPLLGYLKGSVYFASWSISPIGTILPLAKYDWLQRLHDKLRMHDLLSWSWYL